MPGTAIGVDAYRRLIQYGIAVRVDSADLILHLVVYVALQKVGLDDLGWMIDRQRRNHYCVFHLGEDR
jgi:hypothetical protein